MCLLSPGGCAVPQGTDGHPGGVCEGNGQTGDFIYSSLKQFYLFLAVLGLHGHEDVSPVAASGDCSLVAGLAVLIVVASLVVEHRL